MVQVLPEEEGQFNHPPKVEPLDGVAVSAIGSPLVNCAAHAPTGQDMPVGELVTVPVPFPANAIVNTAFVALPPGHNGSLGPQFC